MNNCSKFIIISEFDRQIKASPFPNQICEIEVKCKNFNANPPLYTHLSTTIKLTSYSYYGQTNNVPNYAPRDLSDLVFYKGSIPIE